MRLNLHEIINIPGGKVAFDYMPDVSGLQFDSVLKTLEAVRAQGKIENNAGVLVLSAHITGRLLCSCDRCLAEFEKSIDIHAEAVLADEVQDEDNPEIFLLDGDYIDVDEVIITAFVLNMEQRFLCREDCKGLCDKCGKNLNDGPCSCKPETDPRLAVLRQLLEDE